MADYNAQTEIYCNNGCGKKFAMADIKPLVEVVQHKSHVERYYFNCPFCGENFSAYASAKQKFCSKKCYSISKGAVIHER